MKFEMLIWPVEYLQSRTCKPLKPFNRIIINMMYRSFVSTIYWKINVNITNTTTTYTFNIKAMTGNTMQKMKRKQNHL